MTPRLDSRLTESDSAPETYRSQASEINRVPETEFNYMAIKEKSRKTSDTDVNREPKTTKLNLHDICEDCEPEKVERIKTRPPFSKLQNTSIKMAFSKSQRRASEQSSNKERQLVTNSMALTTPRDPKSRLSLPKI